MSVDNLTREELSYIQSRARYLTRTTPWLADDLVGRVCLDLVRRPDLTENHPLTQAANMLLKSRRYDQLKKREPIPVGTSDDDWENRTPPVSLADEDAQWDELYEWLACKVTKRAAQAAILLARFNVDHREIASLLAVSRFVVSRDLATVRAALSSGTPSSPRTALETPACAA